MSSSITKYKEFNFQQILTEKIWNSIEILIRFLLELACWCQKKTWINDLSSANERFRKFRETYYTNLIFSHVTENPQNFKSIERSLGGLSASKNVERRGAPCDPS